MKGNFNYANEQIRKIINNAPLGFPRPGIAWACWFGNTSWFLCNTRVVKFSRGCGELWVQITTKKNPNKQTNVLKNITNKLLRSLEGHHQSVKGTLMARLKELN